MGLRSTFVRNVLEFCVVTARWLLCICLSNTDIFRFKYQCCFLAVSFLGAWWYCLCDHLFKMSVNQWKFFLLLNFLSTIIKSVELNKHFFKEEMQMAKKHMKKCSTLLYIREMQIKATTRHHLTTVRMTIIKKNSNEVKMWRKWNLLHYWWECKLVLPLWKTVWEFLKDKQTKK